MFFHWRVFLHSLILFLILEAIAHKSVADFLLNLIDGKIVLVFFLILILIFIVAISVLKIGQRWTMLPIPIILATSSLGLLALIDSSNRKFVFIFLVWLVYYFALFGIYRFRLFQKDQTARGILSAVAMATIFLYYSWLYGFYLNFSVSLWLVILFFVLPTILINMQYFQLLTENSLKSQIYALVVGFVMAEVAWVVSFWPFGYLTTGVIMLIFYFMLSNLAQNYFLSALSKRKFILNIVFFGILVMIVLVSSRWMPVI